MCEVRAALHSPTASRIGESARDLPTSLTDIISYDHMCGIAICEMSFIIITIIIIIVFIITM